jgi:uncharacterized protein (TIGR00369 family)
MADDTLPPGTGLVPLADVLALGGEALITAWRDGTLPPPPICGTLDFRLVDAAPGFVAFAGMPSKRFYNPIGTVHGGWVGTLLDSCMGCAVHTTLAPGEGYTSIEFKVNFVKAVTDATGEVRVEGRVHLARPPHRDRRRPPGRRQGHRARARHDDVPHHAA